MIIYQVSVLTLGCLVHAYVLHVCLFGVSALTLGGCVCFFSPCTPYQNKQTKLPNKQREHNCIVHGKCPTPYNLSVPLICISEVKNKLQSPNRCPCILKNFPDKVILIPMHYHTLQLLPSIPQISNPCIILRGRPPQIKFYENPSQ